ncbi:MAG: RNA polymerase-associated protein RapA [Alteromonas sp.]|uniref:RNA polymerase-associated protein RapA n=1 Tax=unclassified Alteromonas TaxID=2614992 RepID=UPI00090333F9|nr:MULTISPECIES: RNA polymerase-associated protein RapA [unclassified Alteromonas]APE04861.1 RNA polymerase-binding ATPase [Alteromonas sp. RW2A1]AUC87262.1 RNA polymerase-associated protein RapA [Alteromonas sp. MB-3u-76]MAI65304.1 RNA polymerase-associated protein RapA [Alteromonas sp.]
MSSDSQFSIGQRWLSNTETELGLGAIIGVDFRSVEVLYPATGEARMYTKQEAPLTRLIFDIGDTVKSQDGWEMTVTEKEESQGVFIYHGLREDTKAQSRLPETMLDHHIRLNQPEKRLFSQQLDHPKWFDLRESALRYQYDYQRSTTIGVAGARISLIPHQLHIASEVGSRHAPRVLLADEVGLGKTIEAALIIHQQIKTGRASRILILVPDSLMHQWLVEMLRRVNLAFAIFDESRCEALDEEGINPFDSEQLVLCSIDFLSKSEKRQQQVEDATWDLMVVDEAHHLSWSQEAPSQEYLCVEALANKTPGVLLLTATPDQLGHESHFARLRLLDPARFHSYESFLTEESQYSQLADAVAPLLSDAEPNEKQRTTLCNFAPEVMEHAGDLSTSQNRHALLHQLIDCHGTGRMLFRNRRANIEGFPERKLSAYELALPQEYEAAVESDDLLVALYPERTPCVVNSWTKLDPRVNWLMDFMQDIKPEKILLICASARTAQELGEVIRTQTGIRHSVFHEGMSIVERDKAAHYFADEEEGAQILLCSEIGSEGRNFQFAHHLVLFDLPITPDLLEQRIGRLDRIGQTHTVNIHVPYLAKSAQHVLLDWYHEGLNAFEKTCPTGSGVFDDVKPLLMKACLHPSDMTVRDELINLSVTLNSQLVAQLEAGRDRLLELNASGEGRVEQLLEDIIALDSDQDLSRFMGRVFDAIGVQQDEKGNDCFILMPTEQMVSQLPGLDPEGMTVTYKRRVATTLENVQFLSWDHPLVHTAIDAVLTDVHGKSSMAFIADPELPKGAYWIEALFVLHAQAPKALQLGRFLPQTPVRVCLDAQGNAVDLTFDVKRKVNRKISAQLLKALQQPLSIAIEKTRTLAHQQANQKLHDALNTMHTTLNDEIQRLKDLQKRNPAVRDSEIEFIEQQMNALDKVIQGADVQFDAIRIIVNNP